ncbi:protein HGH1 homolog [Homarus americanus]|uniref:HGH1-like n=1 Tax=Homarus americanus TaxID=6706 RepID=A0A8J5TLI8_HOMAM|nr:protein HGH1 homolog [Homarus americanus]XP_042217359.1 protein HGH1 homolog [Homarus americanus]XP_042217367.1 protein HGH1 homolog [Homarus americanus]KAG7177736.1 HGH1-like [Homarus americanus]
MTKADQINELIQFLAPEGRRDTKSAACMTAAQLTGTPEGLSLLSSRPDALVAIMRLIRDSEIYTGKDAMRALVNISAEESGAAALLAVKDVDVVSEMVKCIEDPNYPHADFACGILANLSKPKHLCQQVFDRISEGPIKLEGLVYILCQINYNKKGAKLHLLAPVITNFSQLADGRRQIMVKDEFVFQRLITFMDYKESKGRRMSVIATIHNCCFEKEYHPWLMGEDVDLVPRLLLPLAGPDTFSEEDNESLPIDLQFLPDDKEREPDPEVRKLLLEALMQLCITRASREIMRSQNIYLILREHHKWEEDQHCVMLNEDVVNLLLRTEEEIGTDDLSAVEVSSDMAAKFIAQDMKYLSGVSSDMSSLTEEPTKGEK